MVLSRNYPNNLLPGLGLWVRNLAYHSKDFCEIKVISPVPYCPPFMRFSKYSRFCKVTRHICDNGLEVFYPRFLVGPGRSLYITEAFSYYIGILNTSDKLHRANGFNIIHAHFTYPDGVVASWLGRRYKIPVIITEHAPWYPNWMDKQFLVRLQAINAANKSAFLIAVSNSVKDTIISFTGHANKVRVIPVGFDKNIFTTSQNGETNKNNQILFVGFINFNKGIDILFKAFHRILKTKQNVKLVLAGGGFYNNTMKQERQLRSIAQKLGLEHQLEFAGINSPTEVAKYMRERSSCITQQSGEFWRCFGRSTCLWNTCCSYQVWRTGKYC